MPTSKPISRLSEAILDMAGDQHRLGVMSDDDYHQITIRHLGESPAQAAQPVHGDEIRTLRERAQLSQAAFARYLNLTPGYISQLERGIKQPKGPVLALFNIMRHKGVEVIL